MDKEFILNELRRTAVGGKPLGRVQFLAQTGIRKLIGRVNIGSGGVMHKERRASKPAP